MGVFRPLAFRHPISRILAFSWTYEHTYVCKNRAKLNGYANHITGVICGYRVEEIDNPLTQKVRYLDKLVDELAKAKPMEKILRSN